MARTTVQRRLFRELFRERPEAQDQPDQVKTTARQLYVREADLLKYGCTEGCPKCHRSPQILYGYAATTEPHSPACGAGIQEEWLKTPEGPRVFWGNGCSSSRSCSVSWIKERGAWLAGSHESRQGSAVMRPPIASRRGFQVATHGIQHVANMYADGLCCRVCLRFLHGNNTQLCQIF